MAKTRRIPFVLNLDDPVDAAIWEALEPMLDRRRASQFIRGAVAHALGVGGLLPPVGPAGLPDPPARRMLPPGPRAAEVPDPGEDQAGAVDEAMGNFLNMFG